MLFFACSKRSEFIAAKGRDCAKIVKVDGGCTGFETMAEYKMWKAQR